jgi:hypothetical protein
MFRFAADENFNNLLLKRLQRDIPSIDILRIQDSPVAEASDDVILEWAAQENRILLTHDLKTIPDFAYNRIAKGLVMPGVFAISGFAPHNLVVNDIILIFGVSEAKEWENRVEYIPFKG